METPSGSKPRHPRRRALLAVAVVLGIVLAGQLISFLKREFGDVRLHPADQATRP